MIRSTASCCVSTSSIHSYVHHSVTYSLSIHPSIHPHHISRTHTHTPTNKHRDISLMPSNRIINHKPPSTNHNAIPTIMPSLVLFLPRLPRLGDNASSVLYSIPSPSSIHPSIHPSPLIPQPFIHQQRPFQFPLSFFLFFLPSLFLLDCVRAAGFGDGGDVVGVERRLVCLGSWQLL
jgi:hypothetical protein